MELWLTGLGSAGVQAVRVLRVLRPDWSEADAARRLMQTPSRLLGDLEAPRAAEMAALLAEAGLKAEARPASSANMEGGSDCELALMISDPAALPGLCQELAVSVGVTPDEAINLLCREPCVVLSGLSEGAAAEWAERLRAKGAGPVVSKPTEAVYDAMAGEAAAALLALLARHAREHGLAAKMPSQPGPGLFAAGLTLDESRWLFDTARRTSVPMRILNRDYQRYDVVLRTPPAADTPAWRTVLVSTFGIPETVAAKLGGALPVALAQGLALPAALAHLEALAEHGAKATAEMIEGRRFALRVEMVGDPTRLETVLAMIGRLGSADIQAGLARRPAEWSGPFSGTQARWLVHEIRQGGGSARLIAL